MEKVQAAQQEVIEELVRLNIAHSRELEMVQLALKICACVLITIVLIFVVLVVIVTVLLAILFMTQIDTSSDVVELQIRNAVCSLTS